MTPTDSSFRDGFQLRELDPKTRKDLTICSLFINHKFTIPEIIFALGENYRDVVEALLEKKVIADRRQERRSLPEGVERRKSKALSAT